MSQTSSVIETPPKQLLLVYPWTYCVNEEPVYKLTENVFKSCMFGCWQTRQDNEYIILIACLAGAGRLIKLCVGCQIEIDSQGNLCCTETACVCWGNLWLWVFVLFFFFSLETCEAQVLTSPSWDIGKNFHQVSPRNAASPTRPLTCKVRKDIFDVLGSDWLATAGLKIWLTQDQGQPFLYCKKKKRNVREATLLMDFIP